MRRLSACAGALAASLLAAGCAVSGGPPDSTIGPD